MTLSERFARVAARVAVIAGNYRTFVVMLGLVVIWAASGPFFAFSTTWELVINTGTTIITFLMVFLIQNSANREARAVALKLDEIIRAVADARNDLIGIETASEETLEQQEQEIVELARAQGAV